MTLARHGHFLLDDQNTWSLSFPFSDRFTTSKLIAAPFTFPWCLREMNDLSAVVYGVIQYVQDQLTEGLFALLSVQ